MAVRQVLRSRSLRTPPLLLVAVLGGLVSCEQAPAPAPAQKTVQQTPARPSPKAPGSRKPGTPTLIQFADYGMAVELPPDWRSEEHLSGLRWYARPVREGKPWPGAHLTLLREDASLSAALGQAPSLDRYSEMKVELEARNSVRHEVLSTARVSADGVPANLWLVEFASKTHRWRSFYLTTLRGEHAYSLAATALAEDMGALEADYRSLFGSWRWLPAPGEAVPQKR